jgi:hypothetical protein
MKRNYLFVVIMVIGFWSCSKKITKKIPESNVPKSELAQFLVWTILPISISACHLQM